MVVGRGLSARLDGDERREERIEVGRRGPGQRGELGVRDRWSDVPALVLPVRREELRVSLRDQLVDGLASAELLDEVLLGDSRLAVLEDVHERCPGVDLLLPEQRDDVAWLETLSGEDVARGRRALLAWLALLRMVFRADRHQYSDPMLFGEPSRAALAARLRAETGRVTPARLLAVAIAQAMVQAKYAADPEIPEPADVRRELAPLLASELPEPDPNA